MRLDVVQVWPRRDNLHAKPHVQRGHAVFRRGSGDDRASTVVSAQPTSSINTRLVLEDALRTV